MLPIVNRSGPPIKYEVYARSVSDLDNSFRRELFVICSQIV